MLPVYEAIDIVKVINKNVGHTQPWVVLTRTPQGLETYIVKLYTPYDIQRHNPVTAEVISNVLAQEFALNAPRAAFIDIPEALLFNKPNEWQVQFENVDKRLKFASLQVQGNQAITGLSKSVYKDKIEIDMLYAFDNLIKNGDRGTLKTNLLVGKKVWLIDHEMAFGINDLNLFALESGAIDEKFTKHHLFYSFLKKSNIKTKTHYFDEFSEYLRMLNVNKLDSYFKQLSNLGYATNEQQIRNWLEKVKQNSATFVNCLKASIV